MKSKLGSAHIYAQSSSLRNNEMMITNKKNRKVSHDSLEIYHATFIELINRIYNNYSDTKSSNLPDNVNINSDDDKEY
ncbi:unnamed protein product [Rhizophagus irregularis]|nr:unnamed protein product [Rhizophagus irregularis]